MAAAADTAETIPLADPGANPALTATRRAMIMTSVVLGSMLYSTTLLIASTLLPQMQGAMAATQDEIAWAMTFNILATAVATPMTGWLVARFGWRQVMVGSMLASRSVPICAVRRTRSRRWFFGGYCKARPARR